MTKTLLVTLTGDRQKQLQYLTKRLMPHLTSGTSWFGRPFTRTWLVIDDGSSPSEAPEKSLYFRRTKHESDPQHTLASQMKYAMSVVDFSDYDNILFVEDDDWYDFSRYLSAYEALLATFPLVGHANLVYYDVSKPGYWNCGNQTSSALAATGITKEILPILKHATDFCVARGSPFIDGELWTRNVPYALITPSSPMVVGMKRYPVGRRSSTMGQTSDTIYRRDASGRILRDLIGLAAVNNFNAHYGYAL